MKTLLKILKSIAAFPFCIVFGILCAVAGFIFLPIYFCDVVIGDFWRDFKWKI